ncbi:MAG: ATP phosphoribosyltransferase regulatory subunit, partial [Muribaculaceae bacterium]|nr:ATP phosphoribosyltransferase regulatory subunit [Muribaculaceae bacterium]
KGLSAEAIDMLRPLLTLSGTNAEKLSTLESLLSSSQVGMKGIEELKFVLDNALALNLKSEVEVDVSLARGLNYYTGTILEVKALDVEMGSISGGGRYDNLTGVFGMDGLSGVGISFGADRIFDVLNTLDLYPADTIATTKVIFINFGMKEAQYCLQLMTQLRSNGISCELYPESSKMKKQMAYANSKDIPFVAMVGESELASGTISIKDMASGEQKNYTIDEAVSLLK